MAQIADLYGDDTYYEKVAEYAANKGEKPAEVYIYGWDIYVHEPSETVEEALELIRENPQMLGHYVRYETLAEGDELSCFYNGELIDFIAHGGAMPFVQNSVTMMPLDALVENFGATVEDDKAPIIIKGIFFVPLSFVKECFGKDVRCVNYTDKAGVIVITDAIIAEMNQALSATVTEESVNGMQADNPLCNINDGNPITPATWLNPVFPIHITFNWDISRRVEKVVLLCSSAFGQGPTNYDVQISVDGATDWVNVGNSGEIEWPSEDPTNKNRIDSHEVIFTPASIKGLRLKINSANTVWNKMVIRDVDIKG